MKDPEKIRDEDLGEYKYLGFLSKFSGRIKYQH